MRLYNRSSVGRYTYIILALTSFGLLINFTNTSNASAETFDANVNINQSLTLNLSSNTVRMVLNPSSKASDEKSITVTVGTNNPAGYKLYANTTDDATDLVNTADSTKTIETLKDDAGGDGYAVNNLPANYWGYNLNNGNYFPFSSGLVVSESNVPVNNNSSALGFASKIDYTKESGEYDLAINFVIVVNPLPVPIKTIADATSLQEVSSKADGGCPDTLSSTTTYALTDPRDGQTYQVARLADGNCWMVTNLNLGAVALKQDLTSSNTNIASDKTISTSDFMNWDRAVSGNALSYTEPKFTPLTTVNTSNGLDTDPTSDTKYGTLYNYCAASGQDSRLCLTSVSAQPDPMYDICPAGWRLPIGGESSDPNNEFNNLYKLTNYNTNAQMRAPVSSGGAAFALAGAFSFSPPAVQGSYGTYWSSTWDTAVSMYSLSLNNYGVQPVNVDYRNGGFSIRCILK